MSIISPWRPAFKIYRQAKTRDLSYLDSAATCLVHQDVTARIADYLDTQFANSHRGFYQLSAQSSLWVEQTRELTAKFINARASNEIIFTSGATEALNLIANGFAKHQLKENQNIVISVAEHHANFLPWLAVCKTMGAELRIVELEASGTVNVSQLAQKVDENTLMICINHCSNVLGTINPIKQVSALAQKYGAKVCVDGAQFVAHDTLDVQSLDCDFYVFSGHKCYAGSGVGVLYVKEQLQGEMQPITLGGGIVTKATVDDYSLCEGPHKFEAGSRNSTAILGLNVALQFIASARNHGAHDYLTGLIAYLDDGIESLPFIQRLSLTKGSSIVSFNIDSVHSHDVASWLDGNQVAVRAGHHCAQPLHDFLGVKNSVRVSLGLYNDSTDIDRLIDALHQAYQMFKVA